METLIIAAVIAFTPITPVPIEPPAPIVEEMPAPEVKPRDIGSGRGCCYHEPERYFVNGIETNYNDLPQVKCSLGNCVDLSVTDNWKNEMRKLAEVLKSLGWNASYWSSLAEWF